MCNLAPNPGLNSFKPIKLVLNGNHNRFASFPDSVVVVRAYAVELVLKSFEVLNVLEIRPVLCGISQGRYGVATRNRRHEIKLRGVLESHD